MKTQTIAGVVIFTALTVALNLSPVKIPAPYAPFLIYQIWEIPIVAALLLYGFSAGATISIINTIVLLGVFPGALPTGPLYNLAAVLSMLFGIYIIDAFATEHFKKGRQAMLTTFSTALGTITRVGIMTLVNLIFLRYPPPVGYSLSLEAVVIMLPIIGLFNATLALYTIPLGYFVARAVSFSTKTPTYSQRLAD